MTAFLPLLVSHVPLEIVIGHPFVVRGEQIFPGLRFFKRQSAIRLCMDAIWTLENSQLSCIMWNPSAFLL